MGNKILHSEYRTCVQELKVSFQPLKISFPQQKINFPLRKTTLGTVIGESRPGSDQRLYGRNSPRDREHKEKVRQVRLNLPDSLFGLVRSSLQPHVVQTRRRSEWDPMLFRQSDPPLPGSSPGQSIKR